MLWDTSAKKLVITGTDGANALEVTDGNVAITDNLTVSGNLTISGTTTTVDTTNTLVTDNLLELNSGATSNANDSGIIIERGSTGNNAILMWDESADVFTVGTTTATADSTGNLANFAAAPFTAAAITGTVLTGTTSGVFASDMTITSGSIVSASGAITFVDENLATTGTVATGALTVGGLGVITNGNGLVVGHTAKVVATGVTSEFQYVGTGADDTAFLHYLASTNKDMAPTYRFVKNANATVGTNSTSVVDDERVGEIRWLATDGTDADTIIAQYYVETDDASPEAGGIGAAHVWKNTPGGGTGGLTENMRLTAAGDLSIGLANKLMFDITGTGDTYIYQESADDLHIVVGNSIYMQIDQDIDAMSFGSSSAPNIQAQAMFDGSWTAGQYGGWGVGVETDVTGAGGGTALSHMGIRPLGQGSITTQNDSITYTDISSLKLAEPGITKGSDTVTVAATLYVANAPDEGATNAAIYVAAGDVYFADNIGVGIAPNADHTIFVRDSETISDNDAHGSFTSQRDLAKTSAAFTSYFAGVISSARINTNNTQAWTNTVGLRGVTAQANILSGVDGVVTGAAAFYAEANAEGGNSTLTNSYGLYLEDQTVGDTSNWSIYNAGSAANNFGSGKSFIGDTLNANMTIGLTINQAANSNQILALKSSDVAHGTSKILVTKETDDFAVFQKSSATGGLIIEAVEDGGSTTEWMRFGVLGRAVDTNKATSSAAAFTIFTSQHDSGGGNADVGSDGNVFAVRARVSGSNLVRVLVDAAGDLYSVTSAQTFDDYDDMALIETYDAARSGSLKEQIKADFGRTMLMDEATLIEAGVLGDTMANGGLTNQTQLSRVLTGGVRQLNQKHMSLAEKVDGLEVELIEAKRQLAAISA